MISFVGFCRRVLGLRLTDAQYVLARVAYEGVDPADLEPQYRGLARELFGPVDRIPPSARETIVQRCGRISGKTTIAAAWGLYRMQSADLSLAGPGRWPAVIVIGPDKEASRLTLDAALEMVETCELAAQLVPPKNATRFALQRFDGRKVLFCSIAKAVGGATARGFWIIDAILDESEFVAPNDPTKAIRDVDLIRAITPRFLPGAKLILSSTPWPAPSETARRFEENFGKPVHAVAALAPTLLMRAGAPGFAEVKDRVDKETEKDPKNARREFDCLDEDVEESFFEQETLKRALDAGRGLRARREKASGGLDTGFIQDACGMVAVERQASRMIVTEAVMRQPKPGAPLVPSVVLAELTHTAVGAGCKAIASDGNYIETSREHAMKAHMVLHRGPTGPQQIEKAYVYLRDCFRNGLVAILPGPHAADIVAQLKSVMAIPRSGGGLSFHLPRKRGQGHADLASALLAASDLDRKTYGALSAPPTELPRIVPATVFSGVAIGGGRQGGAPYSGL